MDLNLLVVFDALMSERHVTRASARIGLSQPAVSKALNRLRHMFKDELFIRSAEGMRPTQRALDLVTPVKQALELLETALEPGEFDPATTRRVFRIATSDLITRVFMPGLMQELDKAAPGVEIRLIPDADDTMERLERHDIDLAILPSPSPPIPFQSQILFDAKDFAVIMREGHPLGDGEVTARRLGEYRHINVSSEGKHNSMIDDFLESQGVVRKVGITINQIIAGPAIVAATDLIMIVPIGLARYQASYQNVIFRPVPFKMPKLIREARMIWHERLSSTAYFQWFRSTALKVSQTGPNYSKRA